MAQKATATALSSSAAAAATTEKAAGLLEHLSDISSREAQTLFAQPWVPGVIMRFLEESERALLMRLAVVPPLPFASVAEWYKDPGECKTLVNHMARLHLIWLQQQQQPEQYYYNNYPVDPAETIVYVEDTLKAAIQKAITGECFVPQAVPGAAAVGASEKRAEKRPWDDLFDSILNSKKSGNSSNVVLAVGASAEAAMATRRFLLNAEIISEKRGLLPFGFEFMLKDTRAQVLLLLDKCLCMYSGRREQDQFVAYSDDMDGISISSSSSSSSSNSSASYGKDLVSVLSLVMWLSTLRPGCRYSYYNAPAAFTHLEHVLQMLEYLELISLDRRDLTLSVKPLLANSVDVRRGFESAESAELFEKNSANIIVESNFNVYAYTSNKHHIELLDLFTRRLKVLPGFYVAKLTLDKVHTALRRGITRQLIENFLTKNAHPCLAEQKAVVPENVVDQLAIWETEKSRYTCHAASKITVTNLDLFNRALKCANAAGATLHYTSEAGTYSLYIKTECKEEIVKKVPELLSKTKQ